MLPRDERIGTSEFRCAFERGQVVRAGLLQARFFRRNDLKNVATQTRAAFVVSRKTGKATVRNRLRRRLREIYRLSDWRHEARLARTDLLVFAGNPALKASNDDLKKSLDELLKRVAQNNQREISRSEVAPGESSPSERFKVDSKTKKDVVVASRSLLRSSVRRFTAGSASLAAAQISKAIPPSGSQPVANDESNAEKDA